LLNTSFVFKLLFLRTNIRFIIDLIRVSSYHIMKQYFLMSILKFDINLYVMYKIISQE